MKKKGPQTLLGRYKNININQFDSLRFYLTGALTPQSTDIKVSTLTITSPMCFKEVNIQVEY
jgi:hypothetical protein